MQDGEVRIGGKAEGRQGETRECARTSEGDPPSSLVGHFWLRSLGSSTTFLHLYMNVSKDGFNRFYAERFVTNSHMDPPFHARNQTTNFSLFFWLGALEFSSCHTRRNLSLVDASNEEVEMKCLKKRRLFSSFWLKGLRNKSSSLVYRILNVIIKK